MPLGNQTFGNTAEGLSSWAVWFRHYNRRATIRRKPYVNVQRYFCQQRHTQFVGLCRDAAMTEDVLLVTAGRTDMGRHVLNHANERCAELVEHINTLAGIQKGDVLRG